MGGRDACFRTTPLINKGFPGDFIRAGQSGRRDRSVIGRFPERVPMTEPMAIRDVTFILKPPTFDAVV